MNPAHGQLILSLLLGALIGRLCGSPWLGQLLGLVLVFSAAVLRWAWRHGREAERRQAHQLAVLSALAERAIREGRVGTCPSCRRTMAEGARRCLYCGAHRGDLPLR